MDEHSLGRRHFLKAVTAVGAAGLPFVSFGRSGLLWPADGPAIPSAIAVSIAGRSPSDAQGLNN